MLASPDVRPGVMDDGKELSLLMQQLTGENAAYIPTFGCKNIGSALGLWQQMAWLFIHNCGIDVTKLTMLLSEAVTAQQHDVCNETVTYV
jgi:hypothetical protein